MNTNEFTAVAKALSDSHRVRAVMALRKGELCVCQITELLALAPSTISKHMSVLKSAGVVDSRKEGRWVYYRLIENAAGVKEIGKITDLVVSILLSDSIIGNDDSAMNAIMSEGLDALCKRQKNCVE